MPYKILVVDDEPDLELLITQKFRAKIRAGELLFDFAGNGAVALDKIINNIEVDIIFTDINMPVMDGFETTQWLHKKYPLIKVLALSMLSDERTIIKIFRLGAKGYLLEDEADGPRFSPWSQPRFMPFDARLRS